MDISIPTTFAAAWIVVLAAVALFVQAVVNQPRWSSTVKRWVTVGIAVVLGTLYMVATGAITELPTEVSETLTYWFIVVAGIIAVGQAVYNFLKPYLEKVEQATARGPLEAEQQPELPYNDPEDPENTI